MKCFQRSKKCRSKHPPNTAASKPHTDKKHPTTMKARDSMLNQCYLKYNFCFTELRLKSQPLQNLKHQDHQEKFTSCLVIIWSFITAVIGNNSQWYFIFLKIQYLYFPHQSKRFIILFANDSLSNVADKTKKKKIKKAKPLCNIFCINLILTLISVKQTYISGVLLNYSRFNVHYMEKNSPEEWICLVKKVDAGQTMSDDPKKPAKARNVALHPEVHLCKKWTG